MSKQMHVGLDIGYNGLKCAYTNPNGSREPATLHRPSGAAPLHALHDAPTGGKVMGHGAAVLVDGASWVGGIDPLLIDARSHTRVHSPAFAESPEYLALFHAALKLIGATQIDVLITGLPVNEYYDDPAKVKALERRLRAVHNVDGSMLVTVSRVIVLPQPVGAYTDTVARLSAHPEDRERMARSSYTTLVIDPGHYSVDWVCLRGQNIVRQSSSSSNLAGRHVIQTILRKLNDTRGRRLPEAVVESAIARGDSTIDVGADAVELAPLLREAADAAIDQVLKDVEAALGPDAHSVNAVVLAGGGAELYREAVARRLGNVHIHMSLQPVLANARGFWLNAVRAGAAVAKTAAAA